MKALILSHMYPRCDSDWNGIFVHEQVKALRAAGVDARVIFGDTLWHSASDLARLALCRNFGRVESGWVAIEGVPTARFTHHVCIEPWWGRAAAISYAAMVRSTLAPLLNEFTPDIVHAHTALLDGTAARCIARQLSLPYVLTEHTGPFTVLTKNPVARWHTRRAVIGASAVVAVSRVLADAMVDHLALSESRRILVLGNGVDPAVFAPHPAPPAEAAVRVLWVGGLLPIKQPVLAIQAFAEAAAAEPRLRLTMIGEGPLRGEMLATIAALGLSGRIEVLPAVSRATLAQHFRNHHFLIISSLAETFCLVAVEALSCGRPVLTTACGGPVEIVEGPSRGEIVAVSHAGLVEGLAAVAQRLDTFDPVALHAYARDRFGFPVIVQRLLDVYRGVLKL